MTSPSSDDTGSPHGGPVFRYPATVVEIDRQDGTDRFGLGRNVNHDPRSRRFAYRSPGTIRRPVRHPTRTPQLNQNGWGACTGFALLRVLGSEPYYSALQATGLLADVLGQRYPFTNDGGFDLYGDLTSRDPFPGTFTYPPPGGEDTGSDGLTGAELMRQVGVIPGYQHTFDLETALDALQDYPLYVGTPWLHEMFYPDAYGRINVAGVEDGGHQWVVDEYVPAGAKPEGYSFVLSNTEAFIGHGGSWGLGFGLEGRVFLPVSGFGRLLANWGDVIVLTPPTQPAPVPDPDVDPAEPADPGETVSAADRAYADKRRAWARGWGLFSNGARRDMREWLERKGL